MANPIRPMLGETTLQQAQLIELDQEQVLAEHDVPALEGDFLQRLGRRGGAIELRGMQSGPEARDELTGLRDAFRAGEPVTFTSDIVSATDIDQTLIEEFEICERAGHPDCFEYRFLLREVAEAPEPEPEEPIDPIEPPVDDDGVLVINVVKENDAAFDASSVTLRVSGTQEDGTELDRTLTNRVGNRWTEDPFPPGRYTAEATALGAAADGTDLTGTVAVEVRAGETAEATITLRDGAAVALRFLVHFRFDNAFIEPCLKQVVHQVADFAAENADLKLVVVGHTDLSGSREYNQSLSERRARSAFAMLRFANDSTVAAAEWDALRRRRTPGTLPSVNDTWGAREYQQILQELGHYNGAIDGDHGPLTDAAVREFKAANGLGAGGTVDDATWAALIQAYLGDDNLSVPDDRFLPNCTDELLRWLGCGELDPVRDTEDAWRPNRRTEFLFVRAEALPADVAEPDTIDLPTLGAGAPGWCVNESRVTTRCCFTERYAGVVDKEGCSATQPRGPRWTRVEAEASPSFVARGSIRFEDGTPYANRRYVLTAPDGEYMDGEVARTSGGLRAGTPYKGVTNDQGQFEYPDNPKRPGIFIIEIREDMVARNVGAPLSEAKGPIVCKRLASDADSFDVVIVSRAVADVIPSIQMPTLGGAPPTGAPTDRAVIVKKPHTLPARRRVVFLASQAFTGSGEVTIEEGAGRIRLFDAPVAGNEIQFNGTDNVFTDQQLQTPGVTLFAEGGPDHSDALDDVAIKLQLTVSGEPGFSETLALTSVEVTLDIGLSRPAAGGDPPFLSEADKIDIGRFTQVRDPNFSHERTMIRIGQPQPAAFVGELSIAPSSANVEIFADEVPADGQAAASRSIPTGDIQADGMRLFVEGLDHSAAVRDVSLQLGIRNLEADGDRVNMTLVRLDFAADDTPATAASTVARFGVWDQAYTPIPAPPNATDLVADFIANDERRMHFRIRDAGAAPGTVTTQWRSVRADGVTDDDAPLNQDLTLTESAAGSRHFISRGVMISPDEIDVDLRIVSGLPADPARREPRRRRESDHRLRRGLIDGFVRNVYSPLTQLGTRLSITAPIFQRDPEERRRLSVRVIQYTSTVAGYVDAEPDTIDPQFASANFRWNQVGVQIDQQATENRAIPGDALIGNQYGGIRNSPQEQAALRDLIPITADNTLTVVFTPVRSGNAYATVFPRGPIPVDPTDPSGPALALSNRFFIFIDPDLDPDSDTLSHELHHVIFNRGDVPVSAGSVPDQFTSFNTRNSGGIATARGLTLPDARIRRRIHNLHSPDPDNDPANNNVLNWARRARTTREPIPAALSAPTNSTGNTLVTTF